MKLRGSCLCLGLTPALQRTLVFNRLTVDEVNRACRVIESAAGKALNTARALAMLGTFADTAGFNGGETGQRVDACLKVYGVGNALTVMKAETRICTTLLDQSDGSVTELVEEAPEPGITTIRRFISDNCVRISKAVMLVISGTLPPFASDDFYVSFVKTATCAKVPVIIDSHRGALINVLFERPFVAKLNVRELATTLKQSMNSEKRILRGMKDLMNMGAQNVVVTQGAKDVYLVTTKQVWRFTPPEIAYPVNPIGSGDCVTAGIAHALLHGKRLCEAVRYGVACGSANVESLTPAELNPKRVAMLARGVKISQC